MQGLLMAGYSWAFDSCTAAGSGPQLSQKEKRCIAQGIATFVDARSHIAQSMAQHAAAAAKDM